MELRELGEFRLIRRIERAVRRRGQGSAVVIGVGDDAAVLRARPGEDVVLTTDAAVEDVHFRWQTESARNIGRRALVANLSDLAAMGARPLGFTAALAAPPSLSVKRVDGLVAGLLHEAAAHGCPLVGGNVTAARKTSLTLAALGAVSRGRALTRGGSAAGDRICVTGRLGAAALALARAERRGRPLRHTPTPRLAAGRALARLRAVRACIDVSDGLRADLAHLLEADGLAAELDLAALPRPPRFTSACAALGVDPQALLLCGGEDYELLFTVRGRSPSAAALGRRLGVSVSEIGRVVPAAAAAGRPLGGGWRHF
ncbi:MAG: thiamine-phosphate kinase [Myxococcota bacterium]